MTLPEVLYILNVDVLVFTLTVLEALLYSTTLLNFVDPWDWDFDDYTDFFWWQFFVFNLACFAGTALACLVSLKLGRKVCLLLQSFATIVALLNIAFSVSLASYWTTVVIGGLAKGGTYAALPSYLADIAATPFRGAALASLHLTYVVSTSLMSLQYKESVTTLGVIYAVLTVLQVGTFWWFAPEAPSFSVSKNRDDEAECTLQKLRGSAEELAAYRELRDLEGVQPRNVKGGLICLALLGVDVLGGSNYLWGYSSSMAEAAGDAKLADTYRVLTVVAACVVVLLVDWAGRKKLLLFSAALLFLGTLLQAIYITNRSSSTTIVDISEYLVVIGYNVGLGSIIWCFIGELLHTSNEPERAAALCSYYFLRYIFREYALDWFQHDPNAVWTLAVFNFAAIIVCSFIPETKKLSLYEIRQLLVK